MVERSGKMLLMIFLMCVLTIVFLIPSTAFAMIPGGRFTERARIILKYANEEAVKLKHYNIDTEHLLLGLIIEGQGIAARALQGLGVSLEKLEVEVKRMIGKPRVLPDVEERKTLAFAPAANQVLQYAVEEARRAGYDHIGTEHILFGMLREKNGIAAKALASFGISTDRIRSVLKPMPSSSSSPKAPAVPPKAPQADDLRDGSRDATQYIQRNLNEAAKDWGEVFLQAGRYRLEGQLSIPPGVTLSGIWSGPHHARLRNGTVLLAYGGRGQEDGPPLITLSPGSAIRGLTIFYPEQTIEDVQPYPWTIRGGGMHNNVMDVTLVNPYKGIDIGSVHNELHYLRNIFGCPLKIGIYINNCTDIGRIENVHFNPHFWARDEGDGVPRPNGGKLIEHLLKEAEAFVFGRTDWEYVLNTFCYGYRIGYHFIGTKEGGCNGNFLGIGADGTQNAVVVHKSAPYGLLITNGEFVSMRAEDPVEIIVGPENSGAVQFNNCAFWGPANQIARIEGTGSVSFVQCNFVYWDHAKKNLPAIQANGGNLTVQSCNFQRPRKQIYLGDNQRSAIIFGNQMKNEISIENESSGDVQIGFNVVN